MDTNPKIGDSDQVLLFKTVSILSTRHGDASLAPRLGDSKNTLLFKWAKLLAQYGP